MTQLLAMSVDCEVSPSIRLRGIDQPASRGDQPLGWGFAWYPAEGAAAMVVKDPTSVGTNALTGVLSDWERFASTLFVAHLRGAAKRTRHQDTHPFSRTYGGRDWLLAHNGDLRHGFRESLGIAPTDAFEPIGRTDSEHLFCWLLNRLRELGAQRIADVTAGQWQTWLRTINALGTLNLLLTDGHTLLAYSDAHGYRPLHWIRRAPPAGPIAFEGPEVSLSLAGEGDESRTALVVSTQPLADEGWSQLAPGSVLAACRGDVAWLVRPAVAPAGQASGEFAPIDPGAVPDREAAVALARVERRLHAPEVAAAGRAREEGDDYHEQTETPRLLRTVHETVYAYTQDVLHSSHLLRLRPVHDEQQEVVSFDLELGVPGSMFTYDDVFGNAAHDVVVRTPYRELAIRATSVVRLQGPARPRLRTVGARQRLPLVWMPWQRQMMMPYLLSPELPESQLRELSEYAMSFAARADYDLVETLRDISRTIHRDYSYVSRSTTLATSAFDVYATRRGVCQDFANLFIALCRLLDIPARYRVGYLHTNATYEHPEQGDESHAWAEVYIPQLGWRGFDPTNDRLAARDHVRVAAGRNYRDAAPVTGTLWAGGRGETLRVRVRVEDAG
jgi:transglutaminase-like putative cysteine protease/predicted glutamine amidotransferase